MAGLGITCYSANGGSRTTQSAKTSSCCTRIQKSEARRDVEYSSVNGTITRWDTTLSNSSLANIMMQPPDLTGIGTDFSHSKLAYSVDDLVDQNLDLLAIAISAMTKLSRLDLNFEK